MSIELVDIYPHKATYAPGEDAELRIELRNSGEAPAQLHLTLHLTYLAKQVDTVERMLMLAENAAETVAIAVPLPAKDARGYGVDAELRDVEQGDAPGTVVARASTALDVLSSWTLAPRYGFFSDFPPHRSDKDAEQAAEWLAKHHINGLQFYDWMWRHDTLLADEDPFVDPLGRALSHATVEQLIDAAHDYNMIAMAYVAVYGATIPYWEAHPEEALYDEHGNPIPFGDDFLYIMNPAPASPWTEHLVGQCRDALDAGFDGIHLDQYGHPKVGFDVEGREVDLPATFRDFIDRVKKQLETPVVFNAVDNWPIEHLTASQQDFAYIEVWPPHVRYYDFWSIVTEARRLSGGKPVVIAAYISPAWSHNVRLANATILASGGTHIELGESGRMLADPYFPKHEAIDDDLAVALRRYYDFVVRYENLLMLDTTDITAAGADRVAIDDVSVSRDGSADTVWTIVRQDEGRDVINLINLCGVESVSWTEELRDGPASLTDLSVRIVAEREIECIWMASPDGEDLSPTALSFTVEDNSADCRLPCLEYWSMVVIEYAETFSS